MARIKIEKTTGPAPEPEKAKVEKPAKPSAGAVESILRGIEDKGREAAGKPRPPRPFSIQPRMSRGLGALVTTVIPENIQVEKEYDELAPLLRVDGALVPQVVKDHLNEVESRALRAHRIYVVAKLDLARYERDCQEAIGAMRDRATDELQAEKDRGERSKQITDADVIGRAATLFPDEWSEINGELARAKAAVDNLAKFATLWEGRRFSLGAINPDRR